MVHSFTGNKEDRPYSDVPETSIRALFSATHPTSDLRHTSICLVTTEQCDSIFNGTFITEKLKIWGAGWLQLCSRGTVVMTRSLIKLLYRVLL